MPVTLADVLREEADTARADTQGSRGEVVDVVAVQAVSLQLLFSNAVRGFVIALSQQASVPDIGLLGTLSLATQLEGGNHVLTQWAHAISPFVRRVVCVRRKTS